MAMPWRRSFGLTGILLALGLFDPCPASIPTTNAAVSVLPLYVWHAHKHSLVLDHKSGCHGSFLHIEVREVEGTSIPDTLTQNLTHLRAN